MMFLKSVLGGIVAMSFGLLIGAGIGLALIKVKDYLKNRNEK